MTEIVTVASYKSLYDDENNVLIVPLSNSEIHYMNLSKRALTYKFIYYYEFNNTDPALISSRLIVYKYNHTNFAITIRNIMEDFYLDKHIYIHAISNEAELISNISNKITRFTLPSNPLIETIQNNIDNNVYVVFETTQNYKWAYAYATYIPVKKVWQAKDGMHDKFIAELNRLGLRYKLI